MDKIDQFLGFLTTVQVAFPAAKQIPPFKIDLLEFLHFGNTQPVKMQAEMCRPMPLKKILREQPEIFTLKSRRPGWQHYCHSEIEKILPQHGMTPSPGE